MMNSVASVKEKEQLRDNELSFKQDMAYSMLFLLAVTPLRMIYRRGNESRNNTMIRRFGTFRT
jgi:hypothetical protein